MLLGGLGVYCFIYYEIKGGIKMGKFTGLEFYLIGFGFTVKEVDKIIAYIKDIEKMRK